MIRHTALVLPDEPYVPGRGMTHPRRRAGNSHLPPLPTTTLTRANWTRTIRYLYAADLFNYGYWWEVHEVLEGLWLRLDHASPTALFLQGLIQATAAVLKKEMGETVASVALLAKARLKLSACPPHSFGLDTTVFLEALAAYLSRDGADPPTWALATGDDARAG
jgi:hypothetical protein